jgi:hypothetical protein
VAALAAVGVLIGSEFLSPRQLQAAPVQRPHDPDGDGLVNQQEAVLGTNAFQADTDGDGFSDLEELARKSSPLFPQSRPANERMRVGMTARGGDAQLHALIALYLPDGDLRNKNFKAGVLVGGRMITLSRGYLLNHAQLALHPARDPVARIVTLDLPISPRFVRYYGHLTVFATLGDAALGIVQAADSIHLIAFGPTIVLQVVNPMLLGTGALSGSGQQTGGSGAGNIGSIYIPLPVGDDPIGWTPGQVCVQQTVVIGVAGPMITQEVITAECQDGWDGYCPSNCSETVGNTYTTIDPVALIGG